MNRNPWWHELGKGTETERTLFCFHHASGSASAFQPWREATASAGMNLVAAQLPGRGSRYGEPLPESIPSLVAALAEQVAARAGRSPFALFGHSLGGLVTFELARQLEARDLPPAHVFIASFPSPDRCHEVRPYYLSTQTDEELIARLARYGATPDEVLRDPEWMGLLLPILRADYALIDRYDYRPGPPLLSPLSVFGGVGDPDYPRRCLEPWETFTRGAFRLRMFEGGHFFLHQSQQRQAVIERIAEDWKGDGER